jgi:hypothetical protein
MNSQVVSHTNFFKFIQEKQTKCKFNAGIVEAAFPLPAKVDTASSNLQSWLHHYPYFGLVVGKFFTVIYFLSCFKMEMIIHFMLMKNKIPTSEQPP